MLCASASIAISSGRRGPRSCGSTARPRRTSNRRPARGPGIEIAGMTAHISHVVDARGRRRASCRAATDAPAVQSEAGLARVADIHPVRAGLSWMEAPRSPAQRGLRRPVAAPRSGARAGGSSDRREHMTAPAPAPPTMDKILPVLHPSSLTPAVGRRLVGPSPVPSGVENAPGSQSRRHEANLNEEAYVNRAKARRGV